MAGEDDVVWVQVSNPNGLGFLEHKTDLSGCNVYSKKRDQSRAWIIRCGWADPNNRDDYSGHKVIVRCMSPHLAHRAEAIVRKKLGLEPNQERGAQA